MDGSKLWAPKPKPIITRRMTSGKTILISAGTFAVMAIGSYYVLTSREIVTFISPFDLKQMEDKIVMLESQSDNYKDAFNAVYENGSIVHLDIDYSKIKGIDIFEDPINHRSMPDYWFKVTDANEIKYSFRNVENMIYNVTDSVERLRDDNIITFNVLKNRVDGNSWNINKLTETVEEIDSSLNDIKQNMVGEEGVVQLKLVSSGTPEQEFLEREMSEPEFVGQEVPELEFIAPEMVEQLIPDTNIVDFGMFVPEIPIQELSQSTGEDSTINVVNTPSFDSVQNLIDNHNLLLYGQNSGTSLVKTSYNTLPINTLTLDVFESIIKDMGVGESITAYDVYAHICANGWIINYEILLDGGKGYFSKDNNGAIIYVENDGFLNLGKKSWPVEMVGGTPHKIIVGQKPVIPFEGSDDGLIAPTD